MSQLREVTTHCKSNFSQRGFVPFIFLKHRNWMIHRDIHFQAGFICSAYLTSCKPLTQTQATFLHWFKCFFPSNSFHFGLHRSVRQVKSASFQFLQYLSLGLEGLIANIMACLIYRTSLIINKLPPLKSKHTLHPDTFFLIFITGVQHRGHNLLVCSGTPREVPGEWGFLKANHVSN